MADNADSGSSSAGYSDSGWESLTSSSSCSSRSDERVVILGNDSYSTSAFEVSVAEASPPAQVNGDYGISSLSGVEGRSSESCRRRAVQGNYEAQIDDRPPQPEALTETDTGVERTEAHRAASNRQCHFTVPASPTDTHQHHQEKGTELSIGSGDLGLGPTTAGIRGQALDSPSPFASATPKLSKPAPRSEENRDLPSRIAKSRSSHAVLFDRDWLDDIKSCRSNGDADTFCLHDEQRQRDQSRKYGLRNTDESRNVVPPGMSAAEIVEGGQRVGAVPAVGGSAAGPSGGGEGAESGSGGSQEKKERGQASIGLAYRAWKEEQQSPLLTDVCKKMAESILRQQATGCGGSREASRNFKRPWHPSQWEAFQLQGCPPPPLNCSKITIPRSLIGRVGADAAMERVRFPPPPPPPQASSRDRLEPTLRSKGAERSVRRGTARQEKKAVSAYLSIKAEEIRTRRDHEAWLSRVEGGLDTPIQDPLSLLGGCVESTRRLKETFAVDRMRCGEGVPPRQADSRETEDRSLRPGDCAGGRTSGRDGSSNENSALDDGVAAERRYFLSTPHLEHLVVSSRCLLAEEEERAARESSEQRERRARITGYPFGHGQDIRGSSQVAGGSRETVEAFARRCLAESTKISA